MTFQVLLGWIVDSYNLTIILPLHYAEWLKEILDDIPPTHEHVILDTWYQIPRELWLMLIALTGASGLFRQIQEALLHVRGNSVNGALTDFCCIAEELLAFPNRNFELMTLTPTLT